MRTPSAITGLLVLTIWLLTGCVVNDYQTYSPAPSPQMEQPNRVYLMLVVPPGVVPQSIAARRNEVIDYLLSNGVLASPEYLVSDVNSANLIVRATLSNEGFYITFIEGTVARIYSGDLNLMPSDYGYYDTIIFYGAFAEGRYYRDHDRGPRRPQPPPPPPKHPMPPRDPRPEIPGHRPEPEHHPVTPTRDDDHRPDRRPNPTDDHRPEKPAAGPAHKDDRGNDRDHAVTPNRPKPVEQQKVSPSDRSPRDVQPRKDDSPPMPRATVPNERPNAPVIRPDRDADRPVVRSRSEEPLRRETATPVVRDPPPAKDAPSKKDDDKQK